MNTSSLDLNFFIFLRANWKLLTTSALVIFLLIVTLGTHYKKNLATNSEPLNIELRPPQIVNLIDFPVEIREQLFFNAGQLGLIKRQMQEWANGHSVIDLDAHADFDNNMKMYLIFMKLRNSTLLYKEHMEINSMLEKSLNSVLNQQIERVRIEKEAQHQRLKALKNRKLLLDQLSKGPHRSLVTIESFKIEDETQKIRENIQALDRGLENLQLIPAQASASGINEYKARQKLNSTLFLCAAFFMSINIGFFITLVSHFFKSTLKNRSA
ncbi:MAG: hypothetical protein AAGB31_15775 [Bdellovibrio sp.]